VFEDMEGLVQERRRAKRRSAFTGRNRAEYYLARGECLRLNAAPMSD
jgi:hypothetical protein